MGSSFLLQLPNNLAPRPRNGKADTLSWKAKYNADSSQEPCGPSPILKPHNFTGAVLLADLFPLFPAATIKQAIFKKQLSGQRWGYIYLGTPRSE